MKSPLFFYKFVPFNRKDILENGLIRFTPAKDFNDPFELTPTLTSLSSDYLEYFASLDEKERNEIEFNNNDYEYSEERNNKIEEKKKLFNKKINQIGVLSLSSNLKIDQLLTVTVPSKDDPRTNLTMWSHYADSHNGFVIEFKKDFIQGVDIKEVHYTENRDFLTFEDIDGNNFDNLFYKKSIEWKYEQEYRAILPLHKAEKIEEHAHLFKIDKSQINSITFGCKTSKENKDIIKKIIKEDTEYSNVAFNHSYLNEEGYFLNFYGEYGKWTNNPKFGPKALAVQKKEF